MVVAFLDELKMGAVLEPPKFPHITVKKKFKLTGIGEDKLVRMLRRGSRASRPMHLELGGVKDYGSEENKVVEVLNPRDWIELHENILRLLGDNIESRDPQFEGKSYYPHLTWKLNGKITLKPEQYANRKFNIDYLYLIQRVDPVISRAKIIARFDV